MVGATPNGARHDRRGLLAFGCAVVLWAAFFGESGAASKATFSELLADLKSPTAKTRLDAVSELCAAASRCGGCRPAIQEILAEYGLADHSDGARRATYAAV